MTGHLKPGVVFGDEYHELVQNCKDGGFALPAVNVVGTNSTNAVLEAAAKQGSDIIIQLSNGGAQFFAGKGCPDAMTARTLGAVSAARHVHLLAEQYGVCVVLHTDHADRSMLPWVDSLLDWGEKHVEETGVPLFSSHMLDLSTEELETNLDECLTRLRRLAKLGMSLEMELGVTGGEEDGIGVDIDEVDNAKLYTQPSEVLHAYETLSPVGHFSVAASFGNVHGVYKPGNVQLRPEILDQSQSLVTETHPNLGGNPLNLVFHGGSGSEKDKISQAISYGVFKMNIDTDTQFAFASGVGSYVKENETAFFHQLDPDTSAPLKKFYDPRAFLRKAEESMIERLEEAITDLGSGGRSLAMN